MTNGDRIRKMMMMNKAGINLFDVGKLVDKPIQLGKYKKCKKHIWENAEKYYKCKKCGAIFIKSILRK